MRKSSQKERGNTGDEDLSVNRVQGVKREKGENVKNFQKKSKKTILREHDRVNVGRGGIKENDSKQPSGRHELS